MARVRDPLSEVFVHFISYCYRVWRSWFSTLGSDKAYFDPIVNHPVADAIRVANLPDTERSVRGRRRRDLMFAA